MKNSIVLCSCKSLNVWLNGWQLGSHICFCIQSMANTFGQEIFRKSSLIQMYSWKWRNISLVLSSNCGYSFLILYQNSKCYFFSLFHWSVFYFEWISCPSALCFTLLNGHIDHLENIGSLGYADLPDVDIVHHAVSLHVMSL